MLKKVLKSLRHVESQGLDYEVISVIRVFNEFIDGLDGLDEYSHIIVVYWMQLRSLNLELSLGVLKYTPRLAYLLLDLHLDPIL